MSHRSRWSLLAHFVVSCQALLAADVELDSASTPAGYISLLLINEAPFPGERGFQSEKDSRAAMLAVLWVLHCRASTVPTGYTQKEVADLDRGSIIEVMTAGGVKGQVDGFYRMGGVLIQEARSCASRTTTRGHSAGTDSRRW